MSILVELAYGRKPLVIRAPAGSQIADVVKTNNSSKGSPSSLDLLLEQALAAPIGQPPWNECAAVAQRVLVIVSDQTRIEPRAKFLSALRSGLRNNSVVTVAIANGTHPPAPIEALGLPDWVDEVINHDARDPHQLVSLGCSGRGTPMIVNRAVLEADLIVLTGSIRPHYFAGFGAGVKALFPGLGQNAAIRINHRLKRKSRARPGIVDENPCRDDMEQIIGQVGAPLFLLNTVVDSTGQAQAVVAGDVIAAHRVGCGLARPFFEIRAPRAKRIIVSDSIPVAASLYQASKMIAAVAPLLLDGGTIFIAAECPEGIGGSYEVVNKAIFELGIKPRLPPTHQICLLSSMTEEQVAPSYCARTSLAELERFPSLLLPRGAANWLITADTGTLDAS